MTDKVIQIKLDAGDSKIQIEKLDNAMTELGASTNQVVATTNTAGKTIEAFGIRLSDADIALGRFIDKTGRVHDATGQFTSGFLASGQSVKDFAMQVNAASGLNTDLTKTAKGVKDAVDGSSNSLGSFGRSAGQAGMQIQQLVGQVQGGVSPFVALSQQAADLGFVLGFPLLGAVVGIGAALAGPLVAAFTEAEEKVDKFKDTLKAIEETQEEFKNNAVTIEVNKLNNEFAAQQRIIDDLKRKQEQYIEAMKSGGNAQSAYSAILFEISSQLTEASAKQKDLADKISEVTSASLANKAATDAQAESVKSMVESLELQRVTLEQGQLEGKLYAAAQKLQLDSLEALPPMIVENIIAIHELEQAQKAQKEAAQELVRVNREQEQQAKQKARDDEQEARRVEREQQRIDQRIANMRLETQTMASEIALQQGLLDGKFSAEQAQLAAQTASKIMAASTEYEQLRALAADDKARQLEAEVAFKEQLKAINEQYAMDQDALSANTMLNQAQYAQQLRDIQFNSAQTALNAMSSFTKQGSALQKGLFLALKGVQAAQAYTSGLTAAMLARATIPYPASEPIAAAQIAAGKISAAAIMATGIAGAFGGGGGSIGGGGGNYSPSAPTLPTTPQSAPQVGSFEITGLAGLQEQLDRLDNDEVLPVSFTKRLVASLESVQRLQGA